MPPPPEELTVEQAAQRLGYKLMTVYFKIRHGDITVRRYGRHLRIRPADNQALFAQREALTK